MSTPRPPGWLAHGTIRRPCTRTPAPAPLRRLARKVQAMNAAIICGDFDCPHDPAFEHRGWPYGCVPKDFSERTGRSKTRSQRRVERPDLPLGYRYEWNGGCDAERATEDQP